MLHVLFNLIFKNPHAVDTFTTSVFQIRNRHEAVKSTCIMWSNGKKWSKYLNLGSLAPKPGHLTTILYFLDVDFIIILTCVRELELLSN